MIQSLFFYLFSFLLVFASSMVITMRNPVHSVLFLIFAFFNAAGLMLLLDAEFVAMLLVIVYVGAVAVLFLFVVMMLDINVAQMKARFAKTLPITIAILAVLVMDLYVVFDSSYTFSLIQRTKLHVTAVADGLTNTHQIGNVLYTNYVYPFQIAGLVLFLAMVSSIVLTLRTRVGVKKQNAYVQNNRSRKDSVEIISVKSGVGINDNR